MRFTHKETKFYFKTTKGLHVIEFGLFRLDKISSPQPEKGFSIKVRFKQEEFIRLKQHIDAILERQQKSPDDWRKFAIEQLPYLKDNTDELIHPDLASELQRSSDFLGMLIASNLPYFYII